MSNTEPSQYNGVEPTRRVALRNDERARQNEREVQRLTREVEQLKSAVRTLHSQLAATDSGGDR